MMTRLPRVGIALLVALALVGCQKEVTRTLENDAREALTASGLKIERTTSGEVKSTDKQLHIWTWSDYISPDVVANFEKATGCKVVIDTFDSNEAMYAKLKAGATGYDLITPSSYLVDQLAREKLIVKLDHARIPNVRKNFAPSFTSQIVDPSFTYNVPYFVTYTGFVYVKDQIPPGADVASWTILENPALKGRVTLLDDIREVIGAGLMFKGYSINSTNAHEIAQAVEQVLKWRKNASKFDAESYKTEVASHQSILGHGYSSDATQLIVGDEENGTEPHAEIGFALPKEGFTIAFDELVIPASAPNPDFAYAFINYVYANSIAKENMEYVQSPMPVQGALDALEEDFRKMILLSPEDVKRGQVLRGLDAKALELYNKAWDKIKASN